MAEPSVCDVMVSIQDLNFSCVLANKRSVLPSACHCAAVCPVLPPPYCVDLGNPTAGLQPMVCAGGRKHFQGNSVCFCLGRDFNFVIGEDMVWFLM